MNKSEETTYESPSFSNEEKNGEKDVEEVTFVPSEVESKENRSFLTKSSVEVEECGICYEPMVCYALGVCNHRSECCTCTLRRRVLFNQMECSFCKVKAFFSLINE